MVAQRLPAFIGAGAPARARNVDDHPVGQVRISLNPFRMVLFMLLKGPSEGVALMGAGRCNYKLFGVSLREKENVGKTNGRVGKAVRCREGNMLLC